MTFKVDICINLIKKIYITFEMFDVLTNIVYIMSNLKNDFASACRDYFYLVDRHFPERGVLKLVGDRYRLDGDQRTILYRGISSRERSELRESLLETHIEGKVLVIDGYNVLFTLLNYRLGRVTFISTDNILRDAGSLHGKFRDEKTFHECIDLLMDYLVQKKPVRVEVYLDSPVSHSEKHAHSIREKLGMSKINGDCLVVKSADWALKNNMQGILSTSDTAVIEKSMVHIFDLPRAILEEAYGAVFLKLSELLIPDQIQNSVDKT